MANDSNRFPLQNATQEILDDPNSRPALPDGSSVGDDNFGKAHRYDTGKSPEIALNNKNVVVEVHKSENEDTLWYRVGKVDDGKIDWHQSHKYDDGKEPSVAINNDGVVVEVHKSENHDTLWYHVGRVKDDKIDWHQSHKYDDGKEPSVAINNDGLVVEVHKSENHDTLWYHVGRVKDDKIDWYQSHKYDDGKEPSVAINNDGLVVEVHKSENHDTLWYHVGRVKDDKIDWHQSHKYDDGKEPSVAINNDGLVVEVHKSENHDTLWYHVGRVKGDKIDWHQSHKYDDGKEPSAAINNDGLVVEVHKSENHDTLWYHVGRVKGDKGKSPWNEVHGKNSYCHCACRGAGNNKEKHHSQHTMNVTKGAPYFYAVLTKDNDSIDFPQGAELTIKGPDGTKYDHDIQNKNQLVITSGSSVRYLIIKDPKPGKWEMAMTAPKGVRFHCECNTVPSKDVYRTITNTLSKHNLTIDNRDTDDATGWRGIALLGLGIILVVAGPVGVALGTIGVMAGGVTGGVGALLITQNYSALKNSEFMRLVAKLNEQIDKFIKEAKEKGFRKTIARYRDLLGNISYSEWKILVLRPHKILQGGLLSYALTYRVVEHMENADKQNAVRHTLWQCLLVKGLSKDLATKLGDAHERERPGHKADNLADEINNIKGQRLADEVDSFAKCESRVKEMLKDGKLQLREDLEKNVKLRSNGNPIKIYKKPSIDAGSDYVGRDGDKVKIIGYPKPDDKDWCEIQHKQRNAGGWVLEKFIEFEKVPEPLL